MEKYYQDHALNLFNNGYSPIPIRPMTKIPFMKKGESWQIKVDKQIIKKWNQNGKGAGSIAVKDIGAIDGDIMDPAMSKKIIAYLEETFSGLLIRVGQAPKFLIPLSPSEAIDHKQKWTWYNRANQKQEIEILSPGDQYFVAYGMHPNGQEYEWIDGKGLLENKAVDLISMDKIDLAEFEDFFDAAAKEAGWTKEKPEVVKKGVTGKISLRDIVAGDFKVPGEHSGAGGLAELRVWLKFLDKNCCNDRDEWIKIGAAIHHETAGSNEGWALFDEWSQISDKYKNKPDTINRWASYQLARGVNGARCITAGSIVQALKDSGEDVWERARSDGEDAKESFKNTIEGCTFGNKKTDQVDNEETKNIEDTIVHELNEKHAIVSLVGKTKVMNFHQAGILNDDLDFSSVADMHAIYANRLVSIGKGKSKKKKSVSKIWMTHPDRRQYSGIVFKPGAVDVGNNYNLWQGLGIEPKKGDWSLYKAHIIDVIANGDIDAGEWIIAWIARIVQDPGGLRPGTALVLRGDQGTGKGVFANVLGVVFGKHFLAVSNGGQLTGRFNSHLKDKVVVFVDEALWAGDKRAEGVIKSIITEPYVTIEQKGIDIIRVDNNINLIIASNNHWVVPAGMDERRFNVRQIPNIRQQDHAYFKKIINQMYKHGGIEGMVYDLLELDISKINLKKFKKTEALLDQAISSMDIFTKYWLERLIEGNLISDGKDTGSEYTDFGQEWGRASVSSMYDDYLYFSERLKDRYPLTPTQYGISFKMLFGKKLAKKRDGVTSSTKKRIHNYYFPSLHECKAIFESKFAGLRLWDEQGNFIADVTSKIIDDEVPF